MNNNTTERTNESKKFVTLDAFYTYKSSWWFSFKTNESWFYLCTDWGFVLSKPFFSNSDYYTNCSYLSSIFSRLFRHTSDRNSNYHDYVSVLSTETRQHFTCLFCSYIKDKYRYLKPLVSYQSSETYGYLADRNRK